jgi:hypothetical protein
VSQTNYDPFYTLVYETLFLQLKPLGKSTNNANGNIPNTLSPPPLMVINNIMCFKKQKIMLLSLLLFFCSVYFIY